MSKKLIWKGNSYGVYTCPRCGGDCLPIMSLQYGEGFSHQCQKCGYLGYELIEPNPYGNGPEGVFYGGRFEDGATVRSDRPDEFMDIPEGCAACGGPYPDCTSSCPLFDDD